VREFNGEEEENEVQRHNEASHKAIKLIILFSSTIKKSQRASERERERERNSY
jgi:hypothetical protein